MGEPGRIHAVGEWWRGLSRAWRTNIALYGLAAISLVALLVQIVAGDGQQPQRVEVASRAPKAPPTSLRPPVTAGATTTTAPAPPATPAPPPPQPATPAPTPAPTPPAPAPLSVDPRPADAPPTIPCRNSTEPRCGPFSWDPPPGDNQPVFVSVSPGVGGQTVTFTVLVTDPDHEVSATSNCTLIEYGDGPAVEPWGCRPVQCPDAHGPWETPVKRTGRHYFYFSHTYDNPGSYTARFTFRTDREGCLNPYGSQGSGQALVTVPGP